MPFDEDSKQRLLADPKSFMDSIVCSVSSSCYTPTLPGKPDRLTFAEPELETHGYKQIAIGNDVGMVRIPAYALAKAKSTDKVWFFGYLIEYIPGKTPITMLGSEADLCFTANMNGCTLGIGSQTPGMNAVIVTHSNSKGKGPQNANTASQRFKASNVVGAGGSLFEPEHYRKTDNNSITFGFRKNGRWEFAYLPWKSVTGGPPSVFKQYGVRDVTMNTVTQEFLKAPL